MIYENVELTGSLNISGSLVVPAGGDDDRENITGSVFFNTGSNRFEIFTGVNGSEWDNIFTGTGGTGGSGGSGVADIEYLVIAGGASGGGGSAGSGGGGGAGGYISSSLSSIESGSSITVTVGAGAAQGASVSVSGIAGTDSSIASSAGTPFTTVTATGGGEGGYSTSDTAGDGGSGGGGSTNNGSFGTGGAGTAGQGNDGGDGASLTTLQWAAGGGGGAGAAGETAEGNNNAGEGGNGLASKITGTSTTRAGGGGGGAWASGGGNGGTGGGGTGGSGTNEGSAATANTGGGGGGGGQDRKGGAGGSGVAIFAYDSGSINAAGGIVGDAGNGRKYHQFNESGTFNVGSTTDFQIVTSGLVLHVDAGDFASRGSSTWTDLSTYDNDITIQSNGNIVNYWLEGDGSGEAGQFERNGGGTATNVAHTGYGNFTGASATNYTIEFWIRSTATGGDSTLGKTIMGRNSSDVWAGISIKSNKLAFIHYNSSWVTNSSTTSINDGSWHHCVVTNFSDETGDLWVDGTKELDGSSTVLSPSGGTRYLKLDSIFRGYNNQNTDGDIAQIRIYDVALTDAQITQNYNATKTNFV